jgi:hypothetical protein
VPTAAARKATNNFKEDHMALSHKNTFGSLKPASHPNGAPAVYQDHIETGLHSLTRAVGNLTTIARSQPEKVDQAKLGLSIAQLLVLAEHLETIQIKDETEDEDE